MENLDNANYQIQCNVIRQLSLIAHQLNPEQQASIIDFCFSNYYPGGRYLTEINIILERGVDIDLKRVKTLINNFRTAIETPNPTFNLTEIYQIEPLLVYTNTLKHFPKEDRGLKWSNTTGH